MKLNHAKTRYMEHDDDGLMEILSFEIDWARGRQHPVIRPKENAFERLTAKKPSEK